MMKMKQNLLNEKALVIAVRSNAVSYDIKKLLITEKSL